MREMRKNDVELIGELYSVSRFDMTVSLQARSQSCLVMLPLQTRNQSG